MNTSAKPRAAPERVQSASSKGDITKDAVNAFIDGARNGKIENAAFWAVESTLTAVMAREAIYTGKPMTWADLKVGEVKPDTLWQKSGRLNACPTTLRKLLQPPATQRWRRRFRPAVSPAIPAPNPRSACIRANPRLIMRPRMDTDSHGFNAVIT